MGAAGLLHGPLTAFFASRQCPGTAIRAATAWALQQAREQHVVIGGFHSPLEQSVLRLLIEAGGQAVVVLARPVATASIPSAWQLALGGGRVAVVSRAALAKRLTEQLAGDRNDLAACLANKIAIAHAGAGGHLSEQCSRWHAQGLAVAPLG